MPCGLPNFNPLLQKLKMNLFEAIFKDPTYGIKEMSNLHKLTSLTNNVVITSRRLQSCFSIFMRCAAEYILVLASELLIYIKQMHKCFWASINSQMLA